MTHLIISYLLLATISVTSCATRIDWSNPQAIAQAIQTEKDPFRKLTTLRGPNCAKNPADDLVIIRAFTVENSPTSYQIYIDDTYYYPIGWGEHG